MQYVPMQYEGPQDRRSCRSELVKADLAVVGGGMAGVCCAITAARAGLKVVLIQDRPLLGGNASSEVRLWVLGATSHMGNNNRWAREGGVIDEILVENTFRNPEGNPLIFDLVLLEKVRQETNIVLLLNTAVFEATKKGPDSIESVRAFCSQNSTMYEVHAPLFCDASGDGILGFLAGAAFRMGAESPEEFGEGFAPPAEYGGLLGDSIYFYSKDVGRPVRFVPPSFALEDIERIPQYRRLNAGEHGCQLWWIEYGGRLDTVHDTERIKWELWKVVYGVWNHIKNSGQFPEAETLTLEWVGAIPGKRESRRFEGEYILVQQDIVEQRRHADAVSYGGWAIDLHPADGVYGEGPSCNQWHTKGVYQIPYRCLYSRNIDNLFLAGRIISASHVAFGSSRVMATCAHNAQAVGMAAVWCRREELRPRELVQPQRMKRLQRDLLAAGQYIPGVLVDDEADLAGRARATASSSLELGRLEPCGESISLDVSRAMLLPLEAGPVPGMTFWFQSEEPAKVEVQLRVCSRHGSFTPDVVLESREVCVEPAGPPKVKNAAYGKAGQTVREDTAATVEFATQLDKDQYAFVCLMARPGIGVRLSDQRITGILALSNSVNTAVATDACQRPPEGAGLDGFEFWLPSRRPGGTNLAMSIESSLRCFEPDNVLGGASRPTIRPNAWVADRTDPQPTLTLEWAAPQTLQRIELCFDTDFDHPMESVLMGHPEAAMPFCVRDYRVLDENDRVLCEVHDNHQTRNSIRLPQPVAISRLHIRVLQTHGAPAAIFSVRCYGPDSRPAD